MVWTKLAKGLFSKSMTGHYAILKMETVMKQPIYTLLARRNDSIYYVNVVRFYLGPETERELESVDLHKWPADEETMTPTNAMFDLADTILTHLGYF